MCEAGADKDAVKKMLISSVTTGYTLLFGGPPTWIDLDLASYQEMVNATGVHMTAIMKDVIELFKNLSGCLVLGEQAFLETNWPQEEEGFKHLIGNTQMLLPP